jgi:succinate dehydrogenase / fumarate reductase flavoprotein subunit
MKGVGVHPDLAGFQDLAHAFDLKASALAARAGPGRIEREELPPIPEDLAALMREVSTVGKFVE